MSLRRSKIPKFIPIISLLILLVLGPIVFSLLQNAGKVEAAWVDDNFSYRNAIPITSHTAAESNVYVTATIDTSASGQFQADCGDLRFTTVGGDILPYYIVSGCVSASTVVHVFFKSMPAGAQTIYYYYGNPSAANGFSSADFATVASSYALGSVASQEKGGAPIAYWKFDDGTGTNAQDSSPNNNDGTITGATWQTEDQCISGKCLFFDGSTSNVAAANLANTTFPSSGTISFWSNLSRWSATDNLFGSQTGASNVNSIRLEWVTGNKYRPIFGNAAGSYDSMDSYTAAVTNAWTYITLTWDQNSSGTIKLYLNGKLDQSKTSMATYYPTVFPSFNIGRGYSGRYSKGFIDDFKIYNYARTAAQIKSDFKSRGTAKGSSASLGRTTRNSEAFSEGLVDYWKMDEASWNGTAGEVLDSSGNGDNGVRVGDATTAAGKFGNGGTFDGTGDYINIASPKTFSSSSLTISAWYYQTSSVADTAGFVNIDSTSSCSGSSWDIGLYYRYGWWFALQNDSGTCANAIPASTPSLNAWHHIVGVYDGSKLQLFVDGTRSGNSTSFSGTVTINDSAWQIAGGDLWSRVFPGKIDEVRIYNRALSPREVRDLYAFAPGPVGYWMLDEGTGTSTVIDSSGNGYSGTMNGSMANDDWVNGYYGKGLSTDTNDYISTSYSLANSKQGTYSLWVKNISVSDSNYTYLFQASTGSNCNEGIPLQRDTSNVRYYITSTSESVYISSPNNSMLMNTWQYLTVTWDTSAVRLYINGILSGTDSAINLTDTSDWGNVRFGGGYCSSANANTEIIDEVKIYNYARTQKQIVEDMNAGHPVGGSPVGSQIAYYKFDEGFGTTTNNSGSGTGINGTITGASWNNNGKFNKALQFVNGSNTWVVIPSDASLRFGSGGMTLSAWIRTSATGITQNIIRKDNGAGLNGYILRIETDNRLRISFLDGTGGQTTYATAGLITDGAWHHVAATLDRTLAKQYLFVDGKQVNSTSTTLSDDNVSYTVKIGGTVASEALTGLIDEVKIYNSALTEDEIKLDYNRGQAMVLGNTGDASSSAGALYCQPGSSDTCNPPVGEWNFNENGGASTYDTSGNGNTGTITGATWNAIGKTGSALDFDGNDDNVNAGSGSSLQLTSTGTVTLWFKANAAFSGAQAAQKHLMSGGPRDFYFSSSSSKLFYFLSDDTTYAVSDSGSWDTNWHFVAATSDGTTVKMYIDGVVQSATGSATGKNFFGNTGALTIGRSSASFPGKIDQVRVFNYARTAAQIALDYNQGKPIGWWKLDECQGVSVFDSSGNSNTGTITIGATGTQTAVGTCTTSGTAWYNGVAGKFNSSLNFDGTDDYVDLGDPSADDVTGAITLSAWIKPTTVTGSSQKIVGDENSAWCGYPCGGYSLYITSGGYLNFSFGDNATGGNTGNWDVVVSDTVLTAGSWQHVVGIWDGTTGSNGMKVYVNGILKGQATAVQTRIDHGTPNTVIGAENDSAGTWRNYFSGQIDDVRIYNYALTASQVKSIYNGGAAVKFGPVTGSP